MSEYDDLMRRVSALEAELAEAKKALEAQKPKDPFKPRGEPWQPIDWTAGMRMPADAAQKMAAIVPDVKGQKFNEHAWAQTRISQPSGLGPPRERRAAMEEETRRKERAAAEAAKKVQPAKDNRSPQTRIFDDIVEYWAGGPNDTSKLK
jgi:hypothetical protein